MTHLQKLDKVSQTEGGLGRVMEGVLEGDLGGVLEGVLEGS